MTVAVVGLACRYPDADSATALWENVLWQRRAFRTVPSERFDLADYFDADRSTPDTTYSTRAALLEDWSFDRAAFRIPGSVYRASDPAHWLALETAARALADAGFPGAEGLDRERVAVVIGNTLTGEVTRATTMRLRWPYVRRVLASALCLSGLSAEAQRAVLDQAAHDYLRPFPETSDESLAGGLSNTIAGRVCNHFDLHGGGYTVDGACASSLLAVITACTSLADGSADFALAGGVDLSLDPFELVGFAKTGALAANSMRVYDTRSDGFWPGEGCGVLALMRTADARARGLRIYAEIAGWGVSSDGKGGITRPEVSGQLLALRRAYARAGVDPSAVGLVEGHGTGTAVGDATELAALAALGIGAAAPGAAAPGSGALGAGVSGAGALGVGVSAGVGSGVGAAIGSVKANIGHTKAAAGAAGLIKATLSLASGVLPPITGCEEPHPLVREAGLRVLREPEEWPAGPRHAGVSGFGFGGINTHLVLSAPAAPRPVARVPRSRPAPRAHTFVVSDPEVLERLVKVGARLSESETHDLAVTLGRTPVGGLVGGLVASAVAGQVEGAVAGALRVGIVATTGAQLAERAARALELLPALRPGVLAADRGVFAGEGVRGRVTLLFPGQGAPVRLPGGDDTAVAQPAIFQASRTATRWLDGLGVVAATAVGHSLGELAALVWAGAIEEEDALRLVRVRGQVMSELGRAGTGMVSVAASAEVATRLSQGLTGLVVAAYNGPESVVVAGSAAEVAELAGRAERAGIRASVLPVTRAFHSPAVADCAAALKDALNAVRFAPPARAVVSTVTGRPLDETDDLAWLLQEQITAPVRFVDALGHVMAGTDLFCETGPGRTLSAHVDGAPAVGTDSDLARAEAAAALFAAGALADPGRLSAGHQARPFDLWRDRRFVANPCSQAPLLTPATTPPPHSRVRPASGTTVPGDDTTESGPSATGRATRGRATPGSGSAGSGTVGGEAAESVSSVVMALAAESIELPVESLDPGLRLLSDLHLTSLRAAQLVASAADAAGRERPIAPLTMADASLAEVIEVIEALPPATEQPVSGPAPGLAPWIRCFGERLVPHHERTTDGPAGSVIHVPDPTDTRELLAAVRRAVASGEALTVLTEGDALSGFLRAVSLEHPELSLTLLRARGAAQPAPVDRIGGRGGEPVSGGSVSGGPVSVGRGLGGLPVSGERGRGGEFGVGERIRARGAGYHEIVLDGMGRAWRPERVLLRLSEGPVPLGRDDVVLVSGGGKGVGYACAAGLALASGARLALLGRSRPGRDAVLDANLADLDRRGVVYAYEPADVTDPAEVAAAVGALRARLGPVTAIVHASGVNRPARFADLSEEEIALHAAPKVGGLAALLAAAGEDRPSLVVSFGSVIGRHGLAGESHYALANGLMRHQVAQLAPGTRALNLDWSVWSGAGMAERLGVLDDLLRGDVTPIPAADGVALFLRLLATPDLPPSVAVHGRLGEPPADPRGEGRFLETVRADCPGVELVADAELSLASDPYLDGHRIDGLAVLPAVVGLEAMAQAAAAVAGGPLAQAVGLAFSAPVVIPDEGPRTVRVCALRSGDRVDVVLRSDETGYRVDHFRASFPLKEIPHAQVPHAQVPHAQVPHAQVPHAQVPHAQVPLGRGAGVGGLPYVLGEAGGVLGDQELYGPLCFHRGRFRRVRELRLLGPYGCEAELAGGSGWFTPEPLLGDPGTNDAVIHALQACVPHRRLLPVGAERMTTGPGSGDVVVRAAQRHEGDGEYVWDVTAKDATGLLVVEWAGLRLKDVGPIAREEPWPPALLEVYLRRAARALGVDTGVRVEAARPRGAGGGSRSHLPPYVMSVTSGTCDWERVVPGAALHALGPGAHPLVEEALVRCAESRDAVATRIWTAIECLSKAGRPPTTPLVVAGMYEGGWLLMRSGAALLASVIVAVAGVDEPVAVTLMTEER